VLNISIISQKLCILFSIFYFLFSLHNASVFAEEAGAKIPVRVHGDNVEYFQDENKVIGTGNVEVNYEDVKLTCEKMTVYLDTKEAIAEGNVRLYQGDYVYYGDSATYNFEKKRGEVLEAGVEAEPWYGKGSAVEKVGDSEYHVKDGYVTSCDLEKPHYKIACREVEIFLGEKIVAKNALMYIGPVPVLYIPFYVHPLGENRPSVTVTPGYDKDWGGFALTKWRYHLNDQIKGNVHLDYREKRDFASGVDIKYDTKSLGEGIIRSYYMNERTIHAERIWDDRDRPTTERERYKAQLRHKWVIDSDTDFKAEYHKFSDSTFLKDYFYRDYEEEENPLTYAAALRQRPFYSGEFMVEKRANHYETVVERLPQFDLDIGKNKFGGTNFYYTSENSISNLGRKFGNDAQEDLDVVRYDTYDELSYLIDLDFLSLYPYAATRQTYYSKDTFGEADWIRGAFYTGLDASARFYKTFGGLRHIVNPVVKYYYNHHPTILPRNLMQFDDIDNIDRANGVRLELENRLQTKRKSDSGMKTVDFARLLVTTDYLFKVEQGSEFTDIDGELELRPYDWLYFEADARYDHTKAKIEKGSWDLIARDTGKDEKWSFGIGQRYEEEFSSQLTSELYYKLNPKWQIRAYERFSLKGSILEEQEYSLVRDLHCWELELLYNRFRPDAHTVWIVFRLKAFPNLPLKASTSYHKPKRESLR